MSEKTLDLEELADEIVRAEYPTYERAIPGVREAIARKKERIKEVLRRYLEQVLRFYLKYEDCPELLLKEHPELANTEVVWGKTLKEFAEHFKDDEGAIWLNLREFNMWLLRYVFREIATDDLELEVFDEQWELLTEIYNESDE